MHMKTLEPNISEEHSAVMKGNIQNDFRLHSRYSALKWFRYKTIEILAGWHCERLIEINAGLSSSPGSWGQLQLHLLLGSWSIPHHKLLHRSALQCSTVFCSVCAARCVPVRPLWLLMQCSHRWCIQRWAVMQCNSISFSLHSIHLVWSPQYTKTSACLSLESTDDLMNGIRVKPPSPRCTGM